MKLTNKQINGMQIHGIPEHMRRGVRLYFEERLRPGGFLIALLSGDLFEALATADPQNREALHGYAMWLWNEAPGGRIAWGSPEAVRRWLSREGA